MTVDECAIRILTDVAPLTLVHLDGKPQQGWDNTVATLLALIYTESERAAGCAEIVAQLNEVDGGPANESRWQGYEIARRFREYAKEILATSPGKVLTVSPHRPVSDGVDAIEHLSSTLPGKVGG